MSKSESAERLVKFPVREKAFAIIPQNGSPFKNAVIGITYPYPEYSIQRTAGTPTNVFEYVLEGEGEILLDGKWHRATAGDVYILRRETLHNYHSDPNAPWKKLWINYVADYISSFMDAYGIQSGIYRAENARAYFEQAFEYARSGASNLHAGYAVAECVHKIIHLAASSERCNSSDETLILDALNASVYEKLSLDALSERLHISKSNLIRIFKRKYGVTPYEYLISAKIATAKLFLKDTKMTVKEIAERLQISDEHYFSSLFLDRVGLRPREYRSKYR